MIKNNIAPLIFIWIGSCLPKWAIASINFAISNNSDRKIILLLDKKSYNRLKNKNYSFEIIFLENHFIKKCGFKGDINLINSFWINSAKRLNILYQYCKINKIKEFFHAEIDNLIFNLEGLDNKFNTEGSGLFAPQHNEEQALASLIYCNKIASIKEVIQYLYPPFLAKSEMDALGLYSNKSRFFYALPTESFLEVKNKWEVLNPKITDGIFDAAAIGQYILGLDPIHEPYKPLFNMFINPNALVEFKDLYFYTENKILFVFFKKINKSYKIYNLHIHSKKINLAISLFNSNSNILRNLSLGKKTLITNRHKLLSGIVISVFHSLKRKIKEILVKKGFINNP